MRTLCCYALVLLMSCTMIQAAHVHSLQWLPWPTQPTIVDFYVMFELQCHFIYDTAETIYMRSSPGLFPTSSHNREIFKDWWPSSMCLCPSGWISHKCPDQLLLKLSTVMRYHGFLMHIIQILALWQHMPIMDIFHLILIYYCCITVHQCLHIYFSNVVQWIGTVGTWCYRDLGFVLKCSNYVWMVLF